MNEFYFGEERSTKWKRGKGRDGDARCFEREQLQGLAGETMSGFKQTMPQDVSYIKYVFDSARRTREDMSTKMSPVNEESSEI